MYFTAFETNPGKTYPSSLHQSLGWRKKAKASGFNACVRPFVSQRGSIVIKDFTYKKKKRKKSRSARLEWKVQDQHFLK